jgi:hypothetical protein
MQIQSDRTVRFKLAEPNKNLAHIEAHPSIALSLQLSLLYVYFVQDEPISDWNVTILKRNNLEQNCFNFR